MAFDFGSMFTGTNPTLDQMTNQSKQVAGFGTGLGESNLTNASNFNSALLGGDPQAIMKLLGPQIGQAQEQGQQQKQTAAQFGNRSGGTNAGMQMLDDRTRAMIQDMISRLTGVAAGNAGSMGEGMLNTGLSANQQAVNQSQMAMQNMMDSIFGGLTSGVGKNVGQMITGGLGKVPGLSAVI
jgi:hypothetical protein